MNSKIALIIIYNHRYDQNIKVLEKMYKKRFSNIFHLIPFYDGIKKNVFTVYENSYYFQGYFAQGFHQFYKKEFEHYLFVADDMVLNPIITENNYKGIFGVDENSSFIPFFEQLHKLTERWSWTIEAGIFKFYREDVEIYKEMPDYNEAEQIFNDRGLEVKPIRIEQLFTPEEIEYRKRVVPDEHADEYQLYYPLVKGYYFTNQKIWPRGLPLDAIGSIGKASDPEKKEFVNVGIWQGLVNSDPDVDSIYRMVLHEPCLFNNRRPIVLKNNTISPFNSQNTCFRRELFPLMYLPTTVTFRFTDILRSFVAQPIMWLYDYYLGFTKATVNQKRNHHHLYSDFQSEIPMFQYTKEVIPIVQSVINNNLSLSDNLYNAYFELVKSKIVESTELYSLDSWLNDLTHLKK